MLQHDDLIQDPLPRRILSLQRRVDRWSRWQNSTAEVWKQWTTRRLVVGLILAAAIVRTALPDSSPIWAAITFFALLPAFLFCVRITSRIRSKIRTAQGLRDFFARQLARLEGTYFDPRQAAEPEDPDLQRTGEKSLLSQIDESFTTEGRGHLKKMLFDFVDLAQTRQHQKLIQSLLPGSWQITRWLVHGQVQTRKINLSKIDGLFDSFRLTPQDKFHSYLSLFGFTLFLTLWAVLGSGSSWVWLVFFAQGLVHLAYLPRSARLLHRALELSLHWHHLDQQTRLLFAHPMWRKSLPSEVIFKKFSLKQSSRLKTWIGFADINNHPLLSLFVHLAIPWLPVVCLFLGRFMERWKVGWPAWRAEFVQIEKFSSLTLFAKWQALGFAEFSHQVKLRAEEIYHPLIDHKSRVANDVEFAPPLRTVLLSGSNMAGKSTFLRTLAINQILAVAGLPVYARKFETFHGPVLSCIQISDSLRDGFSYFLSEVLRLKEVLKKASRPDQPALVVIDEIFRGTNNRERRLGSQSVIKKLIDTPSLSVVSTHDLELTQLAEGDRRVQNYHFREDYSGDEMIFHYKLHKGPSPTTNALKIMAAHGLYNEPTH